MTTIWSPNLNGEWRFIVQCELNIVSVSCFRQLLTVVYIFMVVVILPPFLNWFKICRIFEYCDVYARVLGEHQTQNPIWRMSCNWTILIVSILSSRHGGFFYSFIFVVIWGHLRYMCVMWLLFLIGCLYFEWYMVKFVLANGHKKWIEPF